MIDLRFGDCLVEMRGIADASIDCVITDPPYGINYHHGGNPPGRSDFQIEWDSIAGDESIDGRWLAEAFRVMKPGTALYVSTRWDVEPEWRRLMEAYGFLVKQRLTWHKRVHGKGDLKGTYATTCEDVLFATKGRHVLNHRPSMLLDVGCVPTWEYRYHPHQKPIALPTLLIETSTQPDNTVLDPFVGSGTALLACLNTNRHGIGIESDPVHFATAQRRLASHTPTLFEMA